LTLDPGTNILYTASNYAAIVSALDPNTCAIKYTLNMGSPIYGLAVAVVGLGFAGGDDNQLWVATSSISLTPQQASALDIIDTIAHYGAAILIALVAILLIGRNKLRSLRSNHKPR